MKASFKSLSPLVILLFVSAFARKTSNITNDGLHTTSILCETSMFDNGYKTFVDSILKRMTLDEKIGQLNQMHCEDGSLLEDNARKGLVGSVMSITNPKDFNKIQRIAVEESRLGIPLINARDVIHGFKTIFPIPLGQACSFDPDLIEQAAKISAIETSAVGIRWTFAPMVDISQDPRWGRIAEGCGEDPYLTSILGAAMVRGFQGDDLKDPTSIAACAKHFAGYGAAEGGKDYNSTFIAPNRFRNLYLRPFHSCVNNGVASIMTSFNDNDGIPSTGNKWLVKNILRDEWDYDGVVVTDWNAINEMVDHGYCEDARTATLSAIDATVDIDMMSRAYIGNIKSLIDEGLIDIHQIDDAVRRILELKYSLGLFESPYCDEALNSSVFYAPEHIHTAQKLAEESIVLLKNDNNTLPFNSEIKKILVTGPLADAPYEQLGTWVFDGDAKHSITPLTALKDEFGAENVFFESCLEYSRDNNLDRLRHVKEKAANADIILAFVGEESILSGEAHSMASLSLQGAQSQLIKELSQIGKPVVMIVIAGRPLTIGDEIAVASAVLYSFAPGTMGGPAIVSTLTGKNNPSGKLPITFPMSVGQIPIYYNHTNTGRPAIGNELEVNDIPVGSPQTSLGNKSYYLDFKECLFPFGFGMSYSDFKFSDLRLDKNEYHDNDSIIISFNLENVSDMPGVEVVQVYIRDIHAGLTRPVKELIHFARVALEANDKKSISFSIPVNKLGYWLRNEYIIEPGKFEIFVGSSSTDCLKSSFKYI
ncbi:MAG: glycosyl hydrolase [Bacteroides sp.]|nr:glycosyl hydrolase [Bacteroides sp.]